MVFQDGKPLSNSLKNYILMTIKDMPEIKSVIVETNDPIGPFGAKGIGEPTLIPTAPAIANAIEDAIGVRIKDLPITSEKVFWAIKEKEEGDRQ
ncbi:Nicotinate dehydrogenase medium molybdopterin subunit [bioreactor metagenome]|uniref:Nicotinate dehydrogenase medium molybdopterin subunit n=2 Tax=root TaxID=1 RepID=A0A645JMW8_9ZZZZ